MKLRNKKTDKVIDLDYWTPYALGNEIGFENEYNEEYHYNSLAELYAEWEDYIPKEPLIKDEKIRKAVRAWAEACFNDNEFWVIYLGERDFTLKADRSDAKATFYSDNKIDGIEEDEFYTITELCGEEE